MPLPLLSKIFEINILDQLLNVYLLKKKKRTAVDILMHTIKPERAVEMKIILNASERCVYILEWGLYV